MTAAARRYGRLVQCGQWQRSGAHWAEAVEFVRGGALGRIRSVRAWAHMNWFSALPVLPDGEVPPGVDYDRWLGPAPKRPFNRNRFHTRFRWFWDYAGGLMTDWGVHLIDIALWAMDAKAPRSVVASGGKFAYPEDAQETRCRGVRGSRRTRPSGASTNTPWTSSPACARGASRRATPTPRAWRR